MFENVDVNIILAIYKHFNFLMLSLNCIDGIKWSENKWRKFILGQHGHEEPLSHESPTISQVMSASSSEQQPLFSVSGTPNTVTITATITKMDDDVSKLHTSWI